MAPIMAEIMYVVEAEERRQPRIFDEKGVSAQVYTLYTFVLAVELLLGPYLGGFLAQATG